MSWLTEEEYHAIADEGVDMFNEVLHRVFNKAVERALQMVPHVLPSLLKFAADLKNIEDSYTKANPDLVEHKERLKELIGITSSEHPDWDIPKIVEESGKDLRKELQISSSIGALDLSSLERPGEEKLNGTKLKDN